MELRPVPAKKDAHKLPRSSRPVASSETPDDSIGDMKVLPSPSPTETTGPMQSPVAASSHGEQASPFSPNMDSYGDGLYPLEVSHSASSSCAESWTNGATTDTEGAEQDARSDHSSDRGSVIPKLEPVEDEIFFDNVSTAPLTPSEASIATGAKRSRGRPRKHPINPVPNGQKVTKGRSKTGCITCRRRKKKCDEAKPRCMNCEKNAVVCEGYHEKQVWKSGRDRAAEEQSRRGNNTSAPAPVPLQPMFHGVETAEDAVFWRHYMNHLSSVLTIEIEMRNPFKNILLHLATQYQSLMHSILSVSGAHLDLATPEGRMALLETPTTTQEMLQHRSIHHWNEASSRLRQLWNTLPDQDESDYQMKLAALYGELLFMVLMTRVMGNPSGEHRMHLHAYQSLKQEKPLEDQEFSSFIRGFFQYQLYADDLLWHPDAWSAPPAIEPTQAIDSAPSRFSLPGVSDGLFCYMAEINVIRNRVRGKIAAGLDQLGDYTIYSPAHEILSALRKWSTPWEAGDIRREVAELYKLALWVYLFRTIYPMVPNAVRRSSNTNTNAHHTNIMEGPSDRFRTTRPTPPQPQRRASTASLIADNVSLPNPSPPTSGPPTRSNSMHEQDVASRRPPSPPPSRRPSQDTQNLITMLTAGLAKLQSFGRRDPAQTLLLLPCLILGTSCLEPAQQETVRVAVGVVRGYTGLRSCDRVMELLEEVWRLMEEGDWVAAWDWQETACRMRIDFLCT